MIIFPEVKSELQGHTFVDRDPQVSALRMKLTGAEKKRSKFVNYPQNLVLWYSFFKNTSISVCEVLLTMNGTRCI